MMLAIGPISLLCISRTIEKGRLTGLAIGLGAATADGIYSGIAGFGLTFITSFLSEKELWIRLIGGLFLLCIGVKIFFEKPKSNKVKFKETGLLKNYFITLFLTLASPMTILLFITVFAGLGVGSEIVGDYLSSSFLVIGIFLGSIFFYLMLISLATIFGARIKNRHLAFGNKISGMLIGMFGVIAIINL